ncbi:hypothetical protein AB1K32_06585 [Metabacillus dongyingensis]|uniref:BclA C-terminal domain-containing protein n=1 Tax=Metabacillus dongyingensis TaxID=2874282 RepID=UPI003B8ADC5D
MFASNTDGSLISVVLGGTDIPLPDNQNQDSFTVNGDNTDFTVPEASRYYISYQINTTASVLASSRLLLNDEAAIAGSIITPVLETNQFNNSVIIDLAAEDTISLQPFGLATAAILIGGGAAGAALTIVRME